jgi:hypothetical protein
MYGFLSRDSLPPHDLLAIGRKEVDGYGGRLIDGRVTGITPDTGAGFHVRLDNDPQDGGGDAGSPVVVNRPV